MLKTHSLRRPSMAAAVSAAAIAAVLAGGASAQTVAPSTGSAQSTPPGTGVSTQPGGELDPPPTVYDAGTTAPTTPAPSNAPPALQPGEAAAASQHQDTAPADAGAENGTDIIVTGKFLDTGASSATKLDVRVLDTPFSVASYNGNFLKAIETTAVSDLYRYMTGIQRAGNTGYDITFRGFKTSGNDRNAILTDGLPGLSVRFGSPPTAGVDHIELVKGATSVLYGQAQPGGFINIITKKPKVTPSFEITMRGNLGVGDYDRALGGLLSFDFTGPVVEDGSLTARVVGELGESRGFRRDSFDKPVYVSPSIAWKPWNRTTITLQGEYRYIKTHYDTYLIAPFRDASKVAAIDTTYQEPGDFLIERGATANAFLAHEFSDAVKLNIGYRYVDHYDEQNNYDVAGIRYLTDLTPVVQRRARRQQNIRTYSFGDANLSAKFGTFGLRHTLLLGVGGGKETASLNRLQFYNFPRGPLNAIGLGEVALYNPVIGVLPAPVTYPVFNPGQPANQNWRYTTQKSLGIYASDLIELGEMVKVMVGGRYADERQTIQDLRLTTVPFIRKVDKKFLPLAGLLFQPARNVSFYASYATSFVPVAASAQDIFGLNPFKPTEAKAYEGGIKAELLQKRLNVTAAYFDIRKKNTLNTFNCPTVAELAAQIASGAVTVPAGAQRTSTGAVQPGSGTCSNQLGGERSRGFEVEFNGSPLPGWVLTGGYAHTLARVVSSNIPVQNGARLTNSPDDAFNLWSRYDFQEGFLDDLGIGIGISYIGKRTGLLPTTIVPVNAPEGGTLPLASYTTVDMGLYYKAAGNLDLTLKASNLLDERFIESAGFTGDIQLVPGAPRSLTLTARLGF